MLSHPAASLLALFSPASVLSICMDRDMHLMTLDGRATEQNPILQSQQASHLLQNDRLILCPLLQCEGAQLCHTLGNLQLHAYLAFLPSVCFTVILLLSSNLLHAVLRARRRLLQGAVLLLLLLFRLDQVPRAAWPFCMLVWGARHVCKLKSASQKF